MKIGIMQPYIFPYLGYLQLIHAVDKFIILDDVNFIKRGWINRNRILVNGEEYLFTLPIKKVSQNKLILECEFSNEMWREKLIKTIESSYRKAPFFNDALPLLAKIINNDQTNVSLYIYSHLISIFEYLHVKVKIIPSSAIYNTKELKGQDKIIAICKAENAAHYINPIGGKELYDNAKFTIENIQLGFIKADSVTYKQFSVNFVPQLSIIDVLMFNSKQTIVDFLTQYTFVSNA